MTLYYSYVHFVARGGAIFYLFYFFAWHAYSDRKIGDKDVKMHGQPGSGRSNLFSHIPS